jgi:hypothetical protein
MDYAGAQTSHNVDKNIGKIKANGEFKENSIYN